MITVTDEAKDLLRGMLEQVEEQAGIQEDDVSIRLAAAAPPQSEETEQSEQVAIGLMLDRPHEGDQIVEHEGKRVLLVDESMAGMLEGMTLDAVDTPDGRRLTINQQEE